MDPNAVVGDLQNIVGATQDVKESAERLVDGIAQLFHDAVNQGEQAVRQLAGHLKSNAGQLAAAVVSGGAAGQQQG